METDGTVQGIGAALRQVVVGYRLVGALWLTLLGALVLAIDGGAPPDRPIVVLATIAAVWCWAAVTVGVARRGDLLERRWWTLADLAVAGGTLAAPALAGSEPFFGGYPFSAVLLAAYTGGMASGVAVAGVLAAMSIPLAAGPAELPGVVGLVVFYLVGGAVSGWGAGVIRRHDVERRATEEALARERAARARSQERAATAAHLHDSVLQTLALIQRRAEEAPTVRMLARRQEHDLRRWLHGGDAPAGDRRLAAAVRAAAGDVEAVHGIRVDVVAVGDALLDARGDALVAAAAEAMTNAAKHARVEAIDVYVEADEAQLVVFVRDRGKGFDPTAVPADRHGLRGSIEDRLSRVGGRAVVRSAPDAGTEVVLRLGRRSPEQPEGVAPAEPGATGAA